MSFSDVVETFTEPLNQLLVPVASSAGKTLQDVWELVFGGFGNYVDKKRAVRLKSLEDFKASLENHVASIPHDQLCEPPLSIVGPALDASKYYFEEPEIREMFARLIASSMNSQKSDSVHPSFSEIIRQMSPLDAQNLTYFTRPLPIVEYRQGKQINYGFTVILRNVFLENPNEQDLNKQSISLASLARLGLINIDYDHWLSDENVYSRFEKTDVYQALKTQLSNSVKIQPHMQKGLAIPTPLGTQFIEVCLK